ncbi:LAFE_0F02410g1_1 [Lachancea fermentati]|uniref:LAFE_0F02410g1_1 n=1 Tax=Lachancea fermentati TaxID=4955 RepID=A0A1G4MEM3_LACFM|nr:LAFE_0F02410g1_1 [Lachancea fermentati]
MTEPQSIITQVSASQDPVPVMHEQSEDFLDDDSLIHLNIQENHYFITRDQLMSLPESLLLCLFPSGVFMDRTGEVITNLTSQDEVYIGNFPADCFEYIMDTYVRAQEDLVNYPVDTVFDRGQSSHKEQSRFFSFAAPAPSTASSEAEILHEKPTIIVLREDLDYYCVPQPALVFPADASEELKNDLLNELMVQVKLAAGSYLSSERSVFQGLRSSNRLKRPAKGQTKGKLGPAEQHLMDMLCSSGFHDTSTWGNRAQEPGKTVISSLSLCRLANETTQAFRDRVDEAKHKYEQELKARASMEPLTPSNSHLHLSPTPSQQNEPKRKSRLSAIADNVRSRSASRNRSASTQREPHSPTLYELVPKPNINAKLLLFWKKPARKCWWGEEDVDLDVELRCNYDSASQQLTLHASGVPSHVTIPVKLHIRRVWTLELSVVGVE